MPNLDAVVKVLHVFAEALDGAAEAFDVDVDLLVIPKPTSIAVAVAVTTKQVA